MITERELNAVELSQTKKDFYQLWNETIDVATKLSNLWDPSSTNESDPGIVLLKVLTAIADKLNYQIDKNTLEAFMPSAAQEESMRKLCEMLGYDMKYYRSATTSVKISYLYLDTDGTFKTQGDEKYLSNTDENKVEIAKFTNIKDADDSVNYFTLDTVTLSYSKPIETVPCMEGTLVECETDDDNIISMLQLDDNNRYYLPESQIAENGIFVTNIEDGYELDLWEKVTNLNTQPNAKNVGNLDMILN